MQESGRWVSPSTRNLVPASQNAKRPARRATRRRRDCPGRAITNRAAGSTHKAAISQTQRGNRRFKDLEGEGVMGAAVSGLGALRTSSGGSPAAYCQKWVYI